MSALNPSRLEIWGGHECTISRVGDERRDQSALCGHDERADDIDAFAALGLRALRYPVLWERVEAQRGICDWRASDMQLARARSNNLRIIAGLCHHGSGPNFVDLLSADFSRGLAQHARRVAERYPWIADWTPVNEPLTTARFSALYGHWHPHCRDEHAFWLAVLNQIDAVRFCMREIRDVIPNARLVQTEDLGRTYATAALTEQAAHDNARRWMSWDLLFGRVSPNHDLWERLCGFGFESRLVAMAEAPCAPDIVGINHYLTSDRFLDHRCAAYPEVAPGGNATSDYVDVEAVRVVTPSPAGLAGAIGEAWARYGAPIAITEVHNACTRDEQIRWFAEAWATAQSARQEGAKVIAVTAWSLLGACDWDSLLTRQRNHYEPGAFDVSSKRRRETALARYLRDLSRDGCAPSPMDGQGWWRREVRFAHAPVVVKGAFHSAPALRTIKRQPVLVAGARGVLGKALARACALRNLDWIGTSRQQMSLDNRTEIEHVLDRLKPSAVINATGFVHVDDAEAEPVACRRTNTAAAVLLARLCADRGVHSVTFSTDLVFDGASDAPYLEADAVNPLSVYGASKADAEHEIALLDANVLVVRTAAFFSPDDQHNFAALVVRELTGGRAVDCAEDAVVSPTYVPALADAVLDLVLDHEIGLWHLANAGAVSWAEFARAIAKSKGLDPMAVRGRVRNAMPWRAMRPANSTLGSSRGRILGDLDEAIWRFAHANGQGHARLS